MHYWLMKSEPEAFSLADLKRLGHSPWDGVRNYQARNFMRSMAVGDQVIFYHSNAQPSGIAGLAEVSREAYPDHTAWTPGSVHLDPASTPENPRWWMVELRYVATFSRLVSLDELRTHIELTDMALFNRSRLSVQPLTKEHYTFMVQLASVGLREKYRGETKDIKMKVIEKKGNNKKKKASL